MDKLRAQEHAKLLMLSGQSHKSVTRYLTKTGLARDASAAEALLKDQFPTFRERVGRAILEFFKYGAGNGILKVIGGLVAIYVLLLVFAVIGMPIEYAPVALAGIAAAIYGAMKNH
jgi:hypothetical protein